MPEEAFTFSELRKIQKEEARQDELASRDDRFLLRVADYLQTKKEVSGDSREYRNARRVFDKIIGLREDKIVKNAKLAVQSEIDPSGLELLPEEQELFRNLKQLFGEHREKIDERVENGVDDDITQEVDEREIQDEEADESGDFVTVKAVKEVPEFMGTDLESYGPYEEGERARIPEENAEILVNRGTAEKVDESGI